MDKMKYITLNIDKIEKIFSSYFKVSGVNATMCNNIGEIMYSSGYQNPVIKYLVSEENKKNKNEDYSCVDYKLFQGKYSLKYAYIPIFLGKSKIGAVLLGPVKSDGAELKKFYWEKNTANLSEKDAAGYLNEISVISKEEFLNHIEFVLHLKEYIIETVNERMKRSEIQAQLEKAQEIAKIGNWEYDLIKKTAKWSKIFANIYGIDSRGGFYDKEELVANVHPDDKDSLREIFDKSLYKDKKNECEYRIIKKDNNEIRYVYHKWELEKDENNMPVKVIGIIRDITEVKKANLAYKKSEERFRQVAECAEEWVWETDMKGVFTYSSSVVEKILGFKPEELIGKKSVYDLFPKSIVAEYRKLIQEIVNCKKTFKNFTKYSLSKKGEIVVLDSNGTPFYDEDGKMLGYRGVDMNITAKVNAEMELKQSEEKFRKVFENAWIGIFLSDENMVIKKSNKALQKMLSYKKNELLECSFNSFIASGQPLITKEEYGSVLNGSKESYQTEKKVFSKNGSALWALITITAVRDETGTFLHAIGMVENITERKNALEEIKKMNRELKGLNATKDKLFSIVAHDLRSPFQGMLGISEILTDPDSEQTEEDKTRRIGYLHTLIKSQYDLLQNLLNWAQMQKDAVVINLQEINLFALANEAISTLSANAAKKGTEINNKINQNMLIYADENLMRSLFQNLIANAIKFTNHNGQIRLYSETDELFIHIFVKDNGVGISKENLKKILEPGCKHTTKGTNGELGTGLGIMLCREITERHNGLFSIDSKVGEGTTIKISLPVQAE